MTDRTPRVPTDSLPGITPRDPDRVLCNRLGYFMVNGKRAGLLRCTEGAGHDDYVPGGHRTTLEWADDDVALTEDWPEADDPDETFDVPVIPSELCGFRGCVFLPHADAVHSWTPTLVEPPKPDAVTIGRELDDVIDRVLGEKCDGCGARGDQHFEHCELVARGL